MGGNSAATTFVRAVLTLLVVIAVAVEGVELPGGTVGGLLLTLTTVEVVRRMKPEPFCREILRCISKWLEGSQPKDPGERPIRLPELDGALTALCASFHVDGQQSKAKLLGPASKGQQIANDTHSRFMQQTKADHPYLQRVQEQARPEGLGVRLKEKEEEKIAEGLLNAARIANKLFKRSLNAVRKSSGIPENRLIPGGVKGIQGIKRKLTEKKPLLDLTRATFVFETEKDLKRIMKALRRHFVNVYVINKFAVQWEKTLQPPCIHINVTLAPDRELAELMEPGALWVGEIQLTMQHFLDVSKKSHAFYEILRLPENLPVPRACPVCGLFQTNVKSDDIKDVQNKVVSSSKLVQKGLWNNLPVAFNIVCFGQNPEREEREAVFLNEVKMVTNFDHPNVVKILGVVQDDKHLGFLTTWIEGGTLAKQLNEEKISPDDAWSVADQLCDALMYCHTEGVVHYDLKSSNVLCSGTPLTVILIDFGCSRPLMSSVLGQAVGGTANWRSPEAWQQVSKHQPSADTYSFGCLLIELFSPGHLKPWSNATDSEIRRQVVERKKIPPEVHSIANERVREIAMKCLQFNADDRPSLSWVKQQLKLARVEPILPPSPTICPASQAIKLLGATLPVFLGLVLGLTVALALVAIGVLTVFAAWRLKRGGADRSCRPATSASAVSVMAPPDVRRTSIMNFYTPSATTPTPAAPATIVTTAGATTETIPAIPTTGTPNVASIGAGTTTATTASTTTPTDTTFVTAHATVSLAMTTTATTVSTTTPTDTTFVTAHATVSPAPCLTTIPTDTVSTVTMTTATVTTRSPSRVEIGVMAAADSGPAPADSGPVPRTLIGGLGPKATILEVLQCVWPEREPDYLKWEAELHAEGLRTLSDLRQLKPWVFSSLRINQNLKDALFARVLASEGDTSPLPQLELLLRSDDPLRGIAQIEPHELIIEVEPKGPRDVFEALFLGVRVSLQRCDLNDGGKEFLRGLRVLQFTDHVNLVRLRGISIDREKNCLYLVFQSVSGTLASVNSKLSDPETIVKVFVGFAAGLAYLHKLPPPRIHRNLDPWTVRVDDELVVKLSEFWRTKCIGEETSITPSASDSQLARSFRYMAPECFNKSYQQSPSRDVYSFGLMLREVLEGKEPFAGQNCSQIIASKPKLQPLPLVHPAGLRKHLTELANGCTQLEAERRPSSQIVLETLQRLTTGVASA